MSSKGGNTSDTQAKTAAKPDRTVAILIDWIRFTMPWHDYQSRLVAVERALPRDGSIVLTGERLPNARGYNQCLGLSVGRLHLHTERKGQGIGFEFNGKDCAALRDAGFSFEELWHHIKDNGGHLTVIHFAIDVRGYDADHLDLDLSLTHHAAVSSARDVHSYVGGKIGEGRTEGTTYVGSPSSTRQLRCYNKGAEQGKGEDWTRIELVVKGKRARHIIDAMINVGWSVVGRSMTNAFILWPDCTWWQDAMEGPLADLPDVGRRSTATVDWLLMAADVLRREIAAEQTRGGRVLADAYSFVVHYTKQVDKHGYALTRNREGEHNND